MHSGIFLRKYFLTVLAACMMLLAGNAYAACSSPTGNEGDVRYDTTAKNLYFCNNTAWVAAGMVWQDVPTSDTAAFDTNCLYRVDISYGWQTWLYPQGISPTAMLLILTSQTPSAIYGFSIVSGTKGTGSSCTYNGTAACTAGAAVTVQKMEKLCP